MRLASKQVCVCFVLVCLCDNVFDNVCVFIWVYELIHIYLCILVFIYKLIYVGVLGARMNSGAAQSEETSSMAASWPLTPDCQDDVGQRAAPAEHLSRLLPARPALRVLPRSHHPLHLRQHPGLLVSHMTSRPDLRRSPQTNFFFLFCPSFFSFIFSPLLSLSIS